MNYKALRFSLLLCLIGLYGCQTQAPFDLGRLVNPRMSDEEKITMILEDVQRGMEAQRVYQVLSHVSRAYKDRDGRDFSALQEDLNTLMKNYRNIRITRTPPRIEVRGNRARVTDTFGTIAEPVRADDFPPVNLQGQVILMMEKTGDTWQIIEWGPIT
ncbi:MAG TPA: hypothetical protein PLZ53_08075 [Candidatus Hydrogenedentes bacterium]|jgi:hypothetical protein|nr:MAG: hypothetical protein BWY07_02482 [Candidatus Hydrogenedentes bacterium ADurb.Bin170]HNZ48929.1 hypothetical protein [Candidatus Hydrogenedentota bacterium]HOD95593.1 hypothetical protein [Candidatus Hydrogenedentota bacterium]HOH43062.1 hypothetical protein [Candidatus Hydrogenedentota bacterium]HOM47670.1 hypothetical protein [Candidatus Hydrogenedentota bacterium]